MQFVRTQVLVVAALLYAGAPQQPQDALEAAGMLAIAQLALSNANYSCAQTFSCCNGSHATLSQEMWQHVKAFHSNYHIRELLDSTPRMLERHYTFYNLYDRMRRHQMIQIWAADCYFGVIGILLNAIPAIEFEDGLVAAQEMFNVVQDMLERNNRTEEANWSLPLQPLDVVFPLLLGLQPKPCYGSQLRVFIYDTGNYSSGAVFCSAGQWGVEVLLHRYFAASACRTLDPNEADLFFVPDYRACHLHLAPTYMHKGLTRIEGDDFHSSIIWNHREKYRNPNQVEDHFLNLIKNLEYFPRKQGTDHVFVFSDQGFIVNFTHTFPSWREHIPHSIFLTTEAFTPGCGPSCFSPWKDIVIPGHIDWDRQQTIRSYNRPTHERTLLFNFHGRLPVNHGYYENVTVRASLMKFAPLPLVSVGGFIDDYFEVMGSSHFCIVPEGTSSWTNHLYESFVAGCIPLILSDRYVLPFQGLIDWQKLSVKWPQDHVDEAMYSYVYDLVLNRRPVVEEMKRRVDKASCWFDFYSSDDECSPYRGVLHELERRRATLPEYLYPMHWAV